MSLWIDLANYSVIPNAAEVAGLKALGVEGAIVGVSFGQRAGAQLAALEVRGVQCEEYQFPERLLATRRRWWVDAETPSATVASIRNALRAGAVGVYTRRGWWLENLGSWNVKAEFPDALLWDARYAHGDGPCEITEALRLQGDVRAAIARERSRTPAFRPYGGFTEAAITQWHNSIVIYGVNVDLNEYVAVPAAPEEEDDMKPYLAWDNDRKRIYLIGPFGAAWITQQADADKLAAQFGPMNVAYTQQTIDALVAA